MMAAKNVLNRIYVQRLLSACAFLGFSLTSNAAATFPAFMAQVSGRSTTVGVGTNGTLLVAKSPALGAGSGWVNAGNFGVATVPTGVNVAADSVAVVAGKNVAVTAAGVISKTEMIGVVAGCVTGGVPGCVLSVATVGVPLAMSWLSVSGVRFNPSTGSPETGDPAQCLSSCYSWTVNFNAVQYGTQYAACAAYVAYIGSLYPSDVTTGGVGPTISTCRVVRSDQNGNRVGGNDAAAVVARGSARTADAGSPTWFPATPQSVRDALYNTTPAPMVVDEMAKYGNIKWSMPTIALTGPASVTGDKTTLVDATGIKTVTQSSTPLTYAGPKVTAGPTVETATATNTDGTLRSTTTTTTDSGTAAAPPKDEVPDPCVLNPLRVGCLDIDVPDGKIPKTTKTVTFATEDTFGTGSCPADVMASFKTLGGKSAKIVNWSQFCAQALPIRFLVMALAAIMAFFIVMPGSRVE